MNILAMETLGIAYGGYLHSLRRADLQGSEEETQQKVLAVIGAAAFVGAILAIILIARTPMPL